MTTVYYVPNLVLQSKTLEVLEGIGKKRAGQIMAEIRERFGLGFNIISLANYATFRGFDYDHLKAHLAKEGKPERYVIYKDEMAAILNKSKRTIRRKQQIIREDYDLPPFAPISFNHFSAWANIPEDDIRNYLKQ